MDSYLCKQVAIFNKSEDMKENELYEYNIADMVMEKPLEFYIENERFCIYPVTLGKSYLLQRLIQSLDINKENIELNPFLEALRLCENKSDTVSRIIAYYTTKTKEKLFNECYINERASYFQSNVDIADMAKLLLYVLTSDNVDSSIKYLGLDKEREDQRKVLKVKSKGSNVISFGGKSMYGTLIDAACERYGWTFDYVVWGISYANLRMLMADMITTISLTDEEKKKVHLKTKDYIDGDNPENIDRIRAMFPD